MAATNTLSDLSVILLHEDMVDKNERHIIASLTMIDLHDIARSSRTYGLTNAFVAHPSPTLRSLAGALKTHWEEGFGATYNENRKDALQYVRIVANLDGAIEEIKQRTGKAPRLVSTSAREGGERTSFTEFRALLSASTDPFLLMLGTGWGMSKELLARAEIFLEPIQGVGEYNHLSVRSACAIMLDRIRGR